MQKGRSRPVITPNAPKSQRCTHTTGTRNRCNAIAPRIRKTLRRAEYECRHHHVSVVPIGE